MSTEPCRLMTFILDDFWVIFSHSERYACPSLPHIIGALAQAVSDPHPRGSSCSAATMFVLPVTLLWETI
jgi:hypothetical protein